MAKLKEYNPFSKREEHSPQSVMTYKVLTFVSWLLVHIVNIHFAWNAPSGKWHDRSIWGQNAAYATPFSLSPWIVDVYWVIILILQIAYMYYLWMGEHVVLAANVGSHFIANNLLMFGFVMLWVHAHFWIAELLLIINFVNLMVLYYRHAKSPLLVHVPVVVGPLAWTFVAIFWCGAAMVNAHNLAARIVANVFVWTWLLYGLYFLVVFKDYAMGFALSTLSAALGAHQFMVKLPALQWIFAFTIMAVLFVLSLGIGIPELYGKEVSFTRQNTFVDEDRERAPLLSET